MAYTVATDVCNLALAKIDKSPITPTDLEKPGNNLLAFKCKMFYEIERDMLLELLAPNFARDRIEYDITNLQDTITAITGAKPPVVTGTDISVAGILEGLGVYLWGTGITEYDGQVFYAKNVVDASETFELYYPDGVTPFDGSALSAATAGYVRLAGILQEYQYMFLLPTDCLRVYQMPKSLHYIDNEGEIEADLSSVQRYTVEQGYLLTDEDEPTIKYIKQITDVSKFSAYFIEALACKIGLKITDDKKLKDNMLGELKKLILPEAKYLNAVEKRTKTMSRDHVRSWRKRY